MAKGPNNQTNKTTENPSRFLTIRPRFSVEYYPTSGIFSGVRLSNQGLRTGTRPEWIAWARDEIGLNPIQVASAEAGEEPGEDSEATPREDLPVPMEPQPTDSLEMPELPQELEFPTPPNPELLPEEVSPLEVVPQASP